MPAAARSAHADLDASVFRLVYFVGCCQRRFPFAPTGNRNHRRGHTSLHQFVTDGLGAPDRKAIIVFDGADAVGMTDHDDLWRRITCNGG